MFIFSRLSNAIVTRGSKLLSFAQFPTRTLLSSPTSTHSLSRSKASFISTMSPTSWTPNQYPPAHRSDHVDVYKSKTRGEVRVADPYQWLEDHTDETDVWTSAQDAFTRTHLDKNTDRAKLEQAIRENTDYEKVKSGVDVCTPSCG